MFAPWDSGRGLASGLYRVVISGSRLPEFGPDLTVAQRAVSESESSIPHESARLLEPARRLPDGRAFDALAWLSRYVWQSINHNVYRCQSHS
jgi:hypothetical protein